MRLNTIEYYTHKLFFKYNAIITFIIYIIFLLLFNYESSSVAYCQKSAENITETFDYTPYFYFLAGSVITTLIFLIIIHSGGSGSGDVGSSLTNQESPILPILLQDPVPYRNDDGFITAVVDVKTMAVYNINDNIINGNITNMWVPLSNYLQQIIINYPS